MTSKYLQVLISAENEKQANAILDALLKAKLVASGLITKGPAKIWWKGKVVSMEYYNISALTKAKNRRAVISLIKKISVEEVPMIAFIQFDANKELLNWIDMVIA